MATSTTESATLHRMLVVVLAVTACVLTACTLHQAETTADNNVTTDEQSIIGGALNGTSWCVAELFVHAPGATTGTICTCSVIGFGDTCLTSARCVDPRVVGTGKVFEIKTSTGGPPTTFTVGTSTAVDPLWNPSNPNGGHDIGIVRMANRWVTAGSPCFRGSVNLSTAVSLVGYGANTHSNTGAGTRRSVVASIVSSDSLLFRVGNSNAQACYGDLGGPAIQSPTVWPTVVGVTSFVTDVSSLVCVNGSVSARVDASAAWINQNVPCGNGTCEPGLAETASSCPFDCHTCGDGICAWGPENASNCAVDCLICGNGSCDFPEDSNSCPNDCGFPCLKGDPSILCLQDPDN